MPVKLATLVLGAALTFSTPAFAQNCIRDADCSGGAQCKVVKTGCPNDPETSTCAERRCVGQKKLTFTMRSDGPSSVVQCTTNRDCTIVLSVCDTYKVINKDFKAKWEEQFKVMAARVKCPVWEDKKNNTIPTAQCISNTCTAVNQPE